MSKESLERWHKLDPQNFAAIIIGAIDMCEDKSLYYAMKVFLSNIIVIRIELKIMHAE